MFRKTGTPKPVQRDIVAAITKKSLFDVVRENFKIAKRGTFIHRIIYIGTHLWNKDQDLIDTMGNLIDKCNSSYCDERLTGTLICYDRHFCHILDGSEVTLMRHLRKLFKSDIKKKLKQVKLLVLVHHINRRFIQEWMAYCGQPTVLVEKTNFDSSLEGTMSNLKQCVLKLYRFSEVFARDLYMTLESQGPDDVHNVRKFTPSPVLYREYLPEIKLLDFLLDIKYLRDLEEFYNYYSKLPTAIEYSDAMWPIPCDYIPYNVFEKSFDFTETAQECNILNEFNYDRKESVAK